MTRRKEEAPELRTDSAAGSDQPQADATAEVTPDPALSTSPAAPEPPASPPVPVRRSGMIGPLLGGALAALGGFGLAHFNALGLAPPDQSAEVAALGERIDAAVLALENRQAEFESGLRSEIGAVSARFDALEAAPAVDLSGLAELEQRLQVIETLPAGGDASTAALAAKLADLEQRLAALPQDGSGTAEVEAALARLATVEAEAQARAVEAAALAVAAEQARAFDFLAEAAATGAAFEAELSAVASPRLQAALEPYSAGASSLAQLQAEFPELARAVLQAARAAEPEAGWTARMLDFLAAQTGARSLTPREGDEPDAVLSRAEFALSESRLTDALAELAALDSAITVPLADWLVRAEARAAVDAALAEGP